MAYRSRNTLIDLFSVGQMPTADHFKNLIESTVNILDDGFSKDAQSGIKLAPISEEKGTVMTFLQNMTNEAGASWKFDVRNNDMYICNSDKNGKGQMIRLKQNGEVEIGKEGADIYMKGTLHAEQRAGKRAEQVQADGQWHDITDFLVGVHALEVVCVMGKRSTGKHAILVAHATHCFGAKPRIRRIRSHFGFFGNKLVLRWISSKADRACKLQVKTRLKPGNDIFIQASITSLWDNPLMEKL